MSQNFERVEYKYKLEADQFDKIKDEINKHFQVDKYGETTIQSLYFDTDNDYLVRTSIEHPLYKEKLRLRGYGLVGKDGYAFLEIKKKYDGIVYKRRIKLKEDEVDSLLEKDINALDQVEREIVYFSKIYKGIRPKMLILYDRTSMFGLDNDVRITFDRNIRYRNDNLNLHTNLEGKQLFDGGEILMEIKTGNPYPIWLCELLDSAGIYKTSFSKYGTAYMLNNEFSKGRLKNV